jgi:hypothetical protein
VGYGCMLMARMLIAVSTAVECYVWSVGASPDVLAPLATGRTGDADLDDTVIDLYGLCDLDLPKFDLDARRHG